MLFPSVAAPVTSKVEERVVAPLTPNVPETAVFPFKLTLPVPVENVPVPL